MKKKDLINKCKEIINNYSIGWTDGDKELEILEFWNEYFPNREYYDVIVKYTSKLVC